MLLICIFILFPVFGFLVYKDMRNHIKMHIKLVEYSFIILFVLSAVLFFFGTIIHSAHYTDAIDIVDGGYSPFASEHSLTLIVYFILALTSLIGLWLKGKSLPPLLFVFALIFTITGIGISFLVILQISVNTEFYAAWLFGFLPFSYMITAFVLLFRIVALETATASSKTYKNGILNYLNQKMALTAHQPYFVLLLLFPVFMIVVAVLMVFGQEADSISKVFTETTTWKFSTKTHPPFLDHKGHYLCTVAVCGNPTVVKPLRLGRRHGYEIVVNRQLLIANAFEELIAEATPGLHKVIRNCYDRYGYPLSKKITSEKHSNLVYRLMKPLEYFFLVCLYLCVQKPEEKIAKQYTA